MSESSSETSPRVPRIGITLGDHGGIGAEIIAKALASPSLAGPVLPLIFGHASIVRDAIERYAPALTPCLSLLDALPAGPSAFEAAFDAGPPRIFLHDPCTRAPEKGSIPEANYIQAAVEACLAGAIDAMTTAPISKASMMARGFRYPGHTEYLAELTGTPEVVMAFIAPTLKVALASVHIPLADVVRALTPTWIVRCAEIVLRDLERRFALSNPALALAGINPHCGEAGRLGDEESRILVPAVARLRSKGHRILGPYPADTIFVRAARGEFDCVLAMYHDQGLIPVKLLSFGSAVNVTMGLPIIRTSVDHGVAYDIAGQGIADESSLVAALNLAMEMIRKTWKARTTTIPRTRAEGESPNAPGGAHG